MFISDAGERDRRPRAGGRAKGGRRAGGGDETPANISESETPAARKPEKLMDRKTVYRNTAVQTDAKVGIKSEARIGIENNNFRSHDKSQQKGDNRTTTTPPTQATHQDLAARPNIYANPRRTRRPAGDVVESSTLLRLNIAADVD
ncbi:hypothetical protein EVAR_10452_1 [Eumeta japonica]|uniref:Uncharacterized protein n=1 Tax=Eumeta variegata TaxID=151549 RepID=A0A4C1TH88_EUMVA|nr:hypothetical protein EVAR_10452_1 [Eumeta japonica]